MSRMSHAAGVVAVLCVAGTWVWGQEARDAGARPDGAPEVRAQDPGARAAGAAREGGARPAGLADGREQDPAVRAAREAAVRAAGGGRDEGAARDLTALAGELNLSPEQQAKIQEETKALRTALADWEKQNQEKITNLRLEFQAATQSTNRDLVRTVGEQMRQLQAERGKIETSGQNLILNVLTPEQKAAYAGIRMMQDRDFVAMLRDTKPTPEQETQLKDKARSLGVALAKWDLENGEKLQKLQQQIEEAQAALQPLRDQREKLIADQKAVALALLTPEQKLALAAGTLREQVMGRMRTQLTEEQIAKIGTLCEQAVKDAGPALDKDPRVAEEMRAKVAKAIREQVLTDAQRAQLAAPPAAGR